MRPSLLRNHTIHVCLVQPVQAPYWTERIRALACHKGLSVTLILERDSFAHRPGWGFQPIDGVRTVVLNSAILGSVRECHDLRYTIRGIRSVPWQLPFALSRLKPDVIVLCNATQMLLCLPLKWMTSSSLALIVEDTPHAVRLLSPTARRFKAALYRRADAWFAFSEDAVEFLASIGIRNGVVRTSWSVDVEELAPPEDENLKQDNNRRVRITLVGAFIESKGVLLLLQAWNGLPADLREQAEVLLAGTGPLFKTAQEYLERHEIHEVRLLGQLPYPEVLDLLKSSDLFVLPTLQDLFSLTVLEAMACGCPVITTPFAGARELVHEGINGWLVDPTDIKAFMNVLKRALSMEREDLRRMGDAARKRVQTMDNNLVMERFAEDLIKIAEK
ncbi:MAG: glycosyltransferase family 4 protein [Desulfosoma sp.]